LNSFCSKSFKGQKLRKVTTSGSTGTPFSVFHDEIKRNRHTAENIYFSDIIGCILGSRIYYLRVWNIINKKSWFKSWIQNIVMHDASSLSDENLQNLIEQLQTDESTKSILAFASTHEALSRFAAKYPVQPIPVKVKSLITISETLPEGAREVLKKTFGCPVISRYSNIENGFLAQQCLTENQEYHLNLASFHFELLNPDNDKPVKPGELGRVVVTDLFNYGMPIIRYDTGDMAVLSDRSICGAPGPVFKKIEGRRVDFITDTAGNLLSPHVITNTMWKYASVVSQFQFIQNGHKEYLIKINIGDKEFNQTDILVKDLKSYVGSDAIINLEFVNDIPILASGKRKKIVDNYKQK
jgi:phenylacetate-CoA ligase